MWYILRYILIRTGNRRPEALSEVAITRCVYVVLHGVSFFFLSPFFMPRWFPFFSVTHGRTTWNEHRKEEKYDVQKECSIVVVPPSSLSNQSIPHYSSKPRKKRRRKEKKKKRNDRVLRVPPVFYFLSIVSPSLFSIRLFLLFYPQRVVLTPSHSISDCFLSLNHCSFLIVLVRVGEVPSAREVEEECARMERNRGNWGVMRTTWGFKSRRKRIGEVKGSPREEMKYTQRGREEKKIVKDGGCSWFAR